MKKLLCMIALTAISFGSVFAYGTTHVAKAYMQTDTTKKKKSKPMKKDTSRKKDTVHTQK
jgi:hypothetical protein